MPDAVQIDGSYGEGGGQILRTSVSLSAITGRPLEIYNVRARRSRPGLQPQHLTAVRAAAATCNAELRGDAVGSVRFFFTPRSKVRAGDYRFDIGTAGATCLVAQTVLVPLSHAGGESRVTITGGTHNPLAPPADYLRHVYLPALRRAGLEASVSYARAGFFPKGGGELVLTVSRPADAPIDFTLRGELKRLQVSVVKGSLPDDVGERGVRQVQERIRELGLPLTVDRQYLTSANPGAAVVLAAECEGGLGGFSSLGERGKPMERVANEACSDFRRWWESGHACEEHLADQLVLPLALVKGESHWTTAAVTDHLRTVLWVAQQFLPVEAEIEERLDGSGEVRLHGVDSHGA